MRSRRRTTIGRPWQVGGRGQPADSDGLASATFWPTLASVPADNPQMSLELRYHDLITAPPAEHGFGIYWLRLYSGGGDYVAVVTEVPGNPGGSVMNASEAIVTEIRRRFAINAVELNSYLVIPGGRTGDIHMAWQVHVRPKIRWDKVTFADIEGVLGQRLEPIPAHADLLGRVVALGGDPEDEIEEPVYEAIAVNDLPPPHNPFKCALFERFKTMKAQSGETDDDAQAAAIGRRFLASLTAEDRATCDFHAVDWRAVADESVRILEGSPSAGEDELITLARSTQLPDRERRLLVSLFAEPVLVHEDSFGDGQHRGCALRFSGASRAVVVRRFATVRIESRAWVYTGDG